MSYEEGKWVAKSTLTGDGLPTLSEAIDSVADDELLYIGSGSGFFYIGYKDGAKEYIEKVGPDWIRETDKMIRSGNRRNNQRKQLLQQAILDGNKSKIKEIESDIAATSRYIAVKQTYLDNYIPPLERHLREDPYIRDIFEPGTCLLITGPEASGYWFKHEFDSKHVDYTDEELEEFGTGGREVDIFPTTIQKGEF